MENIRIITFTFYVRHTTNLPCISAVFTDLSLTLIDFQLHIQNSYLFIYIYIYIQYIY